MPHYEIYMEGYLFCPDTSSYCSWQFFFWNLFIKRVCSVARWVGDSKISEKMCLNICVLAWLHVKGFPNPQFVHRVVLISWFEIKETVHSYESYISLQTNMVIFLWSKYIYHVPKERVVKYHPITSIQGPYWEWEWSTPKPLPTTTSKGLYNLTFISTPSFHMSLQSAIM
jgi:hypothetical protein